MFSFDAKGAGQYEEVLSTGSKYLSLLRMDLFGATHGWRAKKLPSLKCATYTAVMNICTVKAYLKMMQKIYI